MRRIVDRRRDQAGAGRPHARRRVAAGRSPFGAAIAVVAALGGLVGLAACGGPQRGAEGEGGAGREQPAAPAAPDTRTPIERRRDAACEQLGPRLTACAVEDARASFTAGKIDRAQLERDTAPAVQRKNTEEFLKACKGATYSSRQVRVLEVCFHDETRCAPLLDCLGHLSDRPASGSR